MKTGTLSGRRGVQLGIGKVSIHPLFLILLGIAVVAHFWMQMVVLFVLISLHELGHAAVANHLGYEVERVTLLPFGGVAKLAYGSIGFHPRDEALIAIAGPVVNLLLVGIAFLCLNVGAWSRPFYDLVVQLNLWIAIFNLLPGLPLDGGRIWRAARSRKLGYEVATREAYRLALLIAAVLLLFGGLALWAGYPHIGALMLGLFLGVSAWVGRREIRVESIRFLDAKRTGRRLTTEPVRALAALGSASVRDIAGRFAPNRYHMVYVRDEQDRLMGILEESDIMEAVFAGEWFTTLEELTTRTQ